MGVSKPPTPPPLHREAGETVSALFMLSLLVCKNETTVVCDYVLLDCIVLTYSKNTLVSVLHFVFIPVSSIQRPPKQEDEKLFSYLNSRLAPQSLSNFKYSVVHQMLHHPPMCFTKLFISLSIIVHIPLVNTVHARRLVCSCSSAANTAFWFLLFLWGTLLPTAI